MTLVYFLIGLKVDWLSNSKYPPFHLKMQLEQPLPFLNCFANWLFWMLSHPLDPGGWDPLSIQGEESSDGWQLASPCSSCHTGFEGTIILPEWAGCAFQYLLFDVTLRLPMHDHSGPLLEPTRSQAWTVLLSWAAEVPWDNQVLDSCCTHCTHGQPVLGSQCTFFFLSITWTQFLCYL